MESKDLNSNKGPKLSLTNKFFELSFIKNTVYSESGYVPIPTSTEQMREAVNGVSKEKLLEDVSAIFDRPEFRTELILKANFLFAGLLLGNVYNTLYVSSSSSHINSISGRSKLLAYLKEYKILDEENLKKLKNNIKYVKNMRIEKILNYNSSTSDQYILFIQCIGKDNFKLKIKELSQLDQLIESIVTPKVLSGYSLDFDDPETEKSEYDHLREIFLTTYSKSGFYTILNGHFDDHEQSRFYMANTPIYTNLLAAWGNLEIACHFLMQEKLTVNDYNRAKQFFAKAVVSCNKFYFSGGNGDKYLVYIVSLMLETMNLLASKAITMKNLHESINIIEAASIFRDVFSAKMSQIYKDEYKQVSLEFQNKSIQLDKLYQEILNQIEQSQSIELTYLFFNTQNIPMEIKCTLLDRLKLTSEEKPNVLHLLSEQAEILWDQMDARKKLLMISKIYQPYYNLMNMKQLEALLLSPNSKIEIKMIICRNLINRAKMDDVDTVDYLINLVYNLNEDIRKLKLNESSFLKKDKDEMNEVLYNLLAMQMNFSLASDDRTITDDALDELMKQWRQFQNDEKQINKIEERKEQGCGFFSQTKYHQTQLQQIQKEKAIQYYLDTMQPLLKKLSSQVIEIQKVLTTLETTTPHIINEQEFHSTYFPDKSNEVQLESPLIKNVDSCMQEINSLQILFKELNEILVKLKEKEHPQAEEQYDPYDVNEQQEIATAKASMAYQLDVQMIRAEKLITEAKDKFQQLSTQLNDKNRSLKYIYSDFLKSAEKAYNEMKENIKEYLKSAAMLNNLIDDSINKSKLSIVRGRCENVQI